MPSPLVTIVSPIYQGAADIASCVESVRAQDYDNWIHLLVDNQSTDGTQEIAKELARSDSRIQFIPSEQHVSILENWNRALSLVSNDSVYVRQLNIDDRLAPNCLSRSVDTAEKNPDVAIISSYFLNGTRLLPRAKHDCEIRISGREVIRGFFLGGSDYLAQPSVLLLRKDAIQRWPEIYTTAGFPPDLASQPPLSQADKEGFLDTLACSDLIFIPEKLVQLRRDPDSATGYAWRVGAWHAGWMELLMRHGEKFLSPDETARAMRNRAFKFVRSSVWRSLKGKGLGDGEFSSFRYHSLVYLIPALRSKGFEREAQILARFARLSGIEV